MNSKLIYDIGMYNGDDTAYYLSQGHNVVAIEASPELVKDAEIRFSKEIEDKRLEILNVGIASEEGFLDFYLNNFSASSNSFDKNIATRDNKEYTLIKVKTKTIDQVVKEKGIPYYMKIDIEGNDIVCLNSLAYCESKPEYISAEVNHVNVILKLRELGYHKFKIIDQYSLLPLELPASKEYAYYQRQLNFKNSTGNFTRIMRLLAGNAINSRLEKNYKAIFKTQHVYGSSGPFANDLAGKWVNVEDALHIYLHYKYEHKRSKKFAGPYYWVDVHATF